MPVAERERSKLLTVNDLQPPRQSDPEFRVTQLIRLVYASRSTFTPRPGQQGLDPGIARILAKSRRNNPQRQIVGALLFGDGCFLQCLEGVAAAVAALLVALAAWAFSRG